MVITMNICLVFISAHCKHWKLLSNLCLGPISIFILRLPASDIHPNCRKPIKNQFMMFNSWICSAHGNNISPLLDNVSLPRLCWPIINITRYSLLFLLPNWQLRLRRPLSQPPSDWCISKGFFPIIFHVFSKHLSPMSRLSSHCDCVVPKNTYRGYLNWFWHRSLDKRAK